jgi:hypothetical protein
MPLKWRPCTWHLEGSWEGGLGSHKFSLVYQHVAGGEGSGRWVWTMNGMPHNATVDRLGFSDTADEAKQAADDVFDQWLEKAGLLVAPPT